MARWGLLSFSGRTRRRVMVVHAILFIGVFLSVTVLATELTAFWARAFGPEREGWVMAMLWVASSVPVIAACARRLHDMGLSARWLLIWPVGAAVLIAIGVALQVGDEQAYGALIQNFSGWFVVGALLPLALSLPPGRKGSNRFGPDPRLRRGQALEEIFR